MHSAEFNILMVKQCMLHCGATFHLPLLAFLPCPLLPLLLPLLARSGSGSGSGSNCRGIFTALFLSDFCRTRALPGVISPSEESMNSD
eukprot:COSAG02_NODE_1146_length_14225_cov_10.142989_4_plen_88_part_00